MILIRINLKYGCLILAFGSEEAREAVTGACAVVTNASAGAISAGLVAVP